MNLDSIKISLDIIELQLESAMTTIESEGIKYIQNNICLLWARDHLYKMKCSLQDAKEWIESQEENQEESNEF